MLGEPPGAGTEQVTCLSALAIEFREAAMVDEKRGASGVEATPDAAEAKKPPAPGEPPKRSEADAQPDTTPPKSPDELKW